MSTVSITVNSYAQTARILIDGKEPSPYSEVSNYKYEHILIRPESVLEAIARELNDEFTLEVTGNLFEFFTLHQASKRVQDCTQCTYVAPKVKIASMARANHLGNNLPPKDFLVSVSAEPGYVIPQLPEKIQYGTLCLYLSPTADSNANIHLHLGDTYNISNNATFTIPYDSVRDDKRAQLLVSVAETFLVNPLIGECVRNHASGNPDIELCGSLEPVVSVSIPQSYEVGVNKEARVIVFPNDAEAPDIRMNSSNPDILTVKGTTLIPVAPGSATIQAYVAGENKPFYSQDVTVDKTIYVAKINIEGVEKVVNEGIPVPIQAVLTPYDAADANTLVWSVSNSHIAYVEDGRLVPIAPGSCTLTAKTSKAETSISFTVCPKLRELHLSEKELILNVGKSTPIEASITPVGAFNGDYTWSTSDKTVAVVVCEDGREYIKAVGIGSCTITCKAADNSVEDTCNITVRSIMYDKTRSSRDVAKIIALVVGGLIVLNMIFNAIYKVADFFTPDEPRSSNSSVVDNNQSKISLYCDSIDNPALMGDYYF